MPAWSDTDIIGRAEELFVAYCLVDESRLLDRIINQTSVKVPFGLAAKVPQTDIAGNTGEKADGAFLSSLSNKPVVYP